MDPIKLRQAEELFFQLADVPAEQRTALLDERCVADPELQSFVLRLLANEVGVMGEFLQTPVAGGALGPAAALDETPKRVGRYSVVRAIGEGGMGTVFEATQDRPHRVVALKLIKLGYASHQVLRRFQHEAEILGQLQSPGIACIHEAGMAEVEYATGVTVQQPFFAMELVRGLSLIAFADAQGLNTRRRLELLATICDAVHHAHQKGVIHRDLKPANILVTPEGVPKILDFGVARFTDSDLQSITMHAGVGQIIGTIQYMSPEQASGNRSELDTRSDVYSLGVIMYELLTGKLPHDLRDRAIPEAARIIRDEEPTRLSTINLSFRGDLETIAAKALEKDKGRRYQSATDLAADIRRYLNDEPIAARPATTLYQFRKFARRHRGTVFAGAAAIVVLIAGVVVSTALAVGQRRALGESEQQRRIAEAVNAFVNEDLLAMASPESQPDRAITLREIVDRASQSIEGRFHSEPLVEAEIRKTLANTYRGLGEYAEATKHAQAALAILDGTFKEDDPERLLAVNRLALIEESSGMSQSAEERLRGAMEIARRTLGDEDETTLTLMNSLALVLDGRQASQEAADLLAHVVEHRTKLLGEEHRDTMHAINNLAKAYVSLRRFHEAEKLHLKEIEICRRVMGSEHPDTLLSLNNLAVLYNNSRQFAKAEPLIREVLDVRTRVLGPDHSRTLESMDALGAMLVGMKRFEEAEPVVKESLARSERAYGPDHPTTLQARERLISLYVMSSRWDDAEPIVLANLEIRRRTQGEDYFKVGVNWCMLGRVDDGKGRLEEALSHTKLCQDILEPLWGADDHFVRQTRIFLCDIARRLDRVDEISQWCDHIGP